MQFDSFQAFVSMGGHGVFVWSVYMITLLVLTSLLWAPLRRRRRFFAEQLMLLRRQQRPDHQTGASVPAK